MTVAADRDEHSEEQAPCRRRPPRNRIQHLRRHGVAVRGETGPPAYLRAYVRRGRDLGAVRAACRLAFGDIPSHFVRADICRDDLLVEIEGIVRVKLEKTRGKEGASR